MATRIVSDTSLTAVADAIREKGGTSSSLTFPDGFVDAIGDIETGGGGGSVVPKKAVNFYDYDGTILYSFTAQEALALTAMPTNPSHTGLTAQGWNWSLANLKTQVTKCGKCDIGQMYVTDDGKTRIYIYIDPNTPENRRTMAVRFSLSDGNYKANVDWGDGTVESLGSTTATNYSHTYTGTGSYVITVKATGGKVRFNGTSGTSGNSIFGPRGNNENTVKYRFIQKIEVGSDVDTLDQYTFMNCEGLSYITIPNNVTAIGRNAFYVCYKLASLTIPNSVTVITTYALYNCLNLMSVVLPDNMTLIYDYALYYCRGLLDIVIPYTVTSISSYALQYCTSITSIVVPDTITSITAYMFYYCYGMSEYHMRRTTPPTLASQTAFTGIPSDCKIYVPYSADHSVLNAYKTATNWSAYASYIVEEAA